MGRRLLAGTVGTLTALALTAAPAGATSVQTEDGAAYSGQLNGTLNQTWTMASSESTISCNGSTFTGQAATAGSGSIDSIDWTQDGTQFCVSTDENRPNPDLSTLGSWGANFTWIDDDTDGTPNATVLLSNVVIAAFPQAFPPPPPCPYVGNHNGTYTSTREVQVDVYNADNTTSGHMELHFSNEPFFNPVPSCGGDTGNVSVNGRYQVVGANGTELVVRENAPPPPTCEDVSVSTGYQQAVVVNLDCSGPGTLTYAIDDPPDRGVISDDPSDGTFTYTPNPGASGPDTFTYHASNSSGSSSTADGTITIGQPPAGGQSGGSGQSGAGQQGVGGQQAGQPKKKCKRPKKSAGAAAKKCKKKR